MVCSGSVSGAINIGSVRSYIICLINLFSHTALVNNHSEGRSIQLFIRVEPDAQIGDIGADPVLVRELGREKVLPIIALLTGNLLSIEIITADRLDPLDRDATWFTLLIIGCFSHIELHAIVLAWIIAACHLAGHCICYSGDDIVSLFLLHQEAMGLALPKSRRDIQVPDVHCKQSSDGCDKDYRANAPEHSFKGASALVRQVNWSGKQVLFPNLIEHF